MISEYQFFGDATALSISADATIYAERFRAYSVTATAGSLKVLLEDATRLKTGGPHFEVINIGANTFTLTNSAGTTLATLTTNQWATVALISNATAAGLWWVSVGTAGSAASPGPTELMYFVGGFTSGQYNRTHEYNQATDTWTAKTNAGYDQFSSSCSPFGGAAHFLGTGTGDHLRVQKYDPDTWTAGTSMPGTSPNTSSMDAATTSAGKAYLFGGNNISTRTAEYDGATWTVKSSRGAGRGWDFLSSPFPAFDISNGTSYLLSGGNLTDEGHNYCDSYIVDTFTALTERPGPVFSDEGRCRNDAAGEVYAVCGHAGSSNGDNVFSNRITKYVVSSATHVAVSAFVLQCSSLMGTQYGTTAYLAMPNSDATGSTATAVIYAFAMSAQTYLTKTAPPARKQNHPQNQAAAIAP